KEAAAVLREREDQASRLIFRHNVINIVPQQTEELSEDVSLLYKAFARVLRYVDSPSFNPETTEQFSVEDKISYIQSLAEREKEIDLDQIFHRCFNRAEIIVTFLAVLELCRLKQVLIQQPNTFDR